MSGNFPEYYFRIRENGAMVFRVDTETRMRRIEMDQIADVNVKHGETKANGKADLSDADLDAIKNWLETRREQLAEREIEDILRTVDHLNLTAVWAQRKATPEELERVSDALLLAMHDLRSVLVRKKSDLLATSPRDAAE